MYENICRKTIEWEKAIAIRYKLGAYQAKDRKTGRISNIRVKDPGRLRRCFEMLREVI